MLRQFWIYLLPEDVDPFLAAIEAVDPGLAVLPSPCFRGAPEALLGGAEAPPAFIDAEQPHRVMLHRAHSAPPALYAGAQPGVRCVDERRSEVLTLAVPAVEPMGLSPARLGAQTHYVEGRERVRKSRDFAQWVSTLFRRLAADYPRTAASFIRVAPGAAEWARAGRGRLLYLHQPIESVPKPGGTGVHLPHGKG